ncbi:putative protein aq_2027 [Proteiniborus sp. DW1]|uniref:HD-GYP domain-containing protein n=1 Tax=Proteiniborus sp. DW1 TaxID=1889883 RepID=UPI00092E1983|nr:HD-GYP domain-containing protein [Proteiniborus sp. DW1]SCG83836.1 putative protein aq_2027 [Proteiniborus sp. DW1]
MIFLPLNMIKEGMINARPIYTSRDFILLDEGVVIKKNYLDKLLELGINCIYVRDDLGDKEIIHDTVRKELRMDSYSVINRIMNNICCFDESEVERIRGIITGIVDILLEIEDVLVNLCEIRAIDNYTYGHSVNVSILSMITALNLGYDKEKLIDLGIGALLHDIGKTKLCLDILNKPSSLTKSEFEHIKKHTILGYEILDSVKNLSFDSKIIALSHHERYDGNGYPHNIKGDDIHEFARIVSIADVYDALTSNRVYRNKISADEALDYIASVSGSQFDDKIVENFISNIVRHPVDWV